MSAADETPQLEWERRNRGRAAAAAFGTAFLPLIGGIVFLSSIREGSDDTAGFLAAVDDGVGGVIAGSILTASGALLLPVALGYLHRATRARRPESPSFALPLLALCAIGVAILAIVQQVLLIDTAADFVAAGDQSEQAADDLLEESAFQTASLVEAGLRLGLGAGIILIALNAMRAGLLGRFMGILGIGVGVFYAIPFLVEPTLIQLFWGTALGLLFLGRWPGGRRGPAWDRVEAIPWPTAADRMEAERRERVEDAQQEAGEGAEPAAAPEPRPASRKRRRGRE